MSAASLTHSHAPERAATHGTPDERGRLVISILLNLSITLVEVIGGILSGSLSLLSDAVHNLSDTVSLGISYTAQHISKWKPTPRKTFGYRRAEIIGAFVNLLTLIILALFLGREAIERFPNPRAIDGNLMFIIAAVGLAANAATAMLLHRGSRNSLNLRSAFLHVLGDGLSSVAVLAGGLLILHYDLYVIDPIITLAISLYLAIHGYRMLRTTIDILMESTPKQVNVTAVLEQMRELDRVIDVHHVHVWQLDESHVILEAHVVIASENLPEMESIKQAIKSRLARVFGITHSTLEMETVPCDPTYASQCYDPEATIPQPRHANEPCPDGRSPVPMSENRQADRGSLISSEECTILWSYCNTET